MENNPGLVQDRAQNSFDSDWTRKKPDIQQQFKQEVHAPASIHINVAFHDIWDPLVVSFFDIFMHVALDWIGHRQMIGP